MKLKILDYRFRKRNLFIYRKFISKENLIPVGCDCHPAYILNALELRKQSLPFDWLYIDSTKGLEYVKENIENKFKYFLTDLEINDKGNPISKKYPFAEFFHEKHIITSEKDRNKMMRRAERFLNLINEKKCSFLYFINSENFNHENDIYSFIESLKAFSNLYLNRHKLYIYIKYDKSSTQDLELAEKLLESIKKETMISARFYYLNRQKYGIWGNPKDYYQLLKDSGIKIKKRLIPAIKTS